MSIAMTQDTFTLVFTLLVKNYFATGFVCAVVNYVRRLKMRFIKQFPKIVTKYLAVTQGFSPWSWVHSFVGYSLLSICLNTAIGHNCDTPKIVSETHCNAISEQDSLFLYYTSHILISSSLTPVNTLVRENCDLSGIQNQISRSQRALTTL